MAANKPLIAATIFMILSIVGLLFTISMYVSKRTTKDELIKSTRINMIGQLESEMERWRNAIYAMIAIASVSVIPVAYLWYQSRKASHAYQQYDYNNLRRITL